VKGRRKAYAHQLYYIIPQKGDKMSYWNNTKKYDELGIDCDLGCCLEYNPQKDFDVDSIKKVLAVYEGERDADDWHWILELNNGKFVYLRGGCDYTGWDCQSWATSTICESAEEALERMDKKDFPLKENQTPANAGLGHCINLLFGGYTEKDGNVYATLKDQLKKGKYLTWREKTNKDMPDLPKIE
jgi:hypothetical protein